MRSRALGSELPQPRRVPVIVENLPTSFDRCVWQEACTRDAGYGVSIICPTGRGEAISAAERSVET